MVNNNLSQNRVTFKVWPKGFRQDVFFKNYFSYAPKALPPYYSYFYFSGMRYTRFRLYCVRSKSYGYISSQSIEAFRKVLAPSFRKRSYHNSKFNICVYPYLNLTKKPAEVRMGGGKGSKIRKSVSPVKPGQILFTIVIFSPYKSMKLLSYASSKLGIPVSVFPILFVLKMIFINKNSKISIIDNSGCTRFRLINVCRFGQGRLGDLCIGSLNRVKARRRLKKGQIFRALFVQSRFRVFRSVGVYIKSLATRSILIKRNEYTPLANRLNSFYFVELKNLQSFRISAITIYSVLFLW